MATVSETSTATELTQAIDALLEPVFAPEEPGASVLAARDGRVVYRRGFGLASLELGVPIQPHMVFRLGSITKQFTAVAILMLVEQGKLSLDDDLTAFLPDYPTQGHRITVEHLLTHTSGIKSYTSMPEWLSLWRRDMSVSELIDLFKDQPMDFAPGERWAYSNSGYILLGAIIEQVSERSYEDFLNERIFAPLGMFHTSYDHTERIVPGRVAGYQKGGDGFEHAPYISMTQPYAAGSLMSSVDDLLLWDEALYTEKLVKQDSLRRAWTPVVTNDGVPSDYGYGWSITAYEGHRTIDHGGGIMGFMTHALRLPDDHVFVAVLMNGTGGETLPEPLAVKIAALLLGRPYREPDAIALDAAALDRYTGVYRIDETSEQIVTRDGDGLVIQRTGGVREELISIAPGEFRFKNGARWFATTVRFTMDGDAVTGLQVQGRGGPPEKATRTDKPLPQARQAIALDPAIYDRYVGRYEIGPGFSLVLSREDDRLMAQASGQERAEIFPESPTRFFLTIVDAQIDFVQNEAGAVTGLVLHQGGQDIPARKVT